MLAKFEQMRPTLIILLLLINSASFSQELLNTIEKAHTSKVVSVKISNDAKYILSKGDDFRTILWDTQTKTKIKIFKGFSNQSNTIDFNHNSTLFIAESSSGNMMTCDAATGKPKAIVMSKGKGVTAIKFHSKKNILTGGTQNGNIILWNEKGKIVKSIEAHKKAVNSIDFSPNGKAFAAGSQDNTIKIFGAISATEMVTLKPKSKEITQILYSSDGNYLVSSHSSGEVILWDTQKYTELHRFDNLKSKVNSISFSSDNNFLAAANDDGNVAIWKIKTKELVKKFKAHESNVSSLALRKNKSQLITAGADNKIKIWNVEELIFIDNTGPDIKILSHAKLKRGFKQIVNEDKIQVEGIIKDNSGVKSAFLDNNEIQLSADGTFSVSLNLNEGQNVFKVKATDKLNNSSEEIYTVELNRGANPLSVSENKITSGGKFYALLIGVSDYSDPGIAKLSGLPIKDAETLQEILINNYTFEKQNIKLLKDATRSDITRALDDLAKNITEIDNVLIFYAGHGFYDKKNDIGYWFPSNAETDYTDNWLYNNNLVDMLKKIQSKHTLLISDACFSGSIFKGRNAFMEDADKAHINMYKLKSRNALTSGALKTVPNKSVFFEYLSKTLRANTDKYMSSRELFNRFFKQVGNYTSNTPQWGDIPRIGDEGGDFIFIKK